MELLLIQVNVEFVIMKQMSRLDLTLARWVPYSKEFKFIFCWSKLLLTLKHKPAKAHQLLASTSIPKRIKCWKSDLKEIYIDWTRQEATYLLQTGSNEVPVGPQTPEGVQPAKNRVPKGEIATKGECCPAKLDTNWCFSYLILANRAGAQAAETGVVSNRQRWVPLQP